MTRLPVGKLPAELLGRLLERAPVSDPRVVLGPGVGLDCAVVDAGEGLLVFKSDPITFVTDDLGYYLVHINANDIATTGATPRWLLVTLLLPERDTTAALAETLFEQIYAACREMDVSVIGGHTEITHGLERPVAVGALVGEVARDGLITPRGARPGDRLLLTKGVPVEATAILAREFPERIAAALGEEALRQARDFLWTPGIAVYEDARIAVSAGEVTAMHDPTEGGLVTALWELAQASARALRVDPDAVPVPTLSARVCEVFGLDPYASIASGALLLAAAPHSVEAITDALTDRGIICACIGEVAQGEVGVWRETPDGPVPWPRPERDAIAGVYDE